MMYEFECPAGHGMEVEAPMGQAPREVRCPQHGATCLRDYSSVRFSNDDPFRRAHLGTAIDQALQKRGRGLDPLAPKDKFEARHIERATGRRYIGDDASSLNPRAQRAVAKSIERKDV